MNCLKQFFFPMRMLSHFLIFIFEFTLDVCGRVRLAVKSSTRGWYLSCPHVPSTTRQVRINVGVEAPQSVTCQSPVLGGERGGFGWLPDTGKKPPSPSENVPHAQSPSVLCATFRTESVWRPRVSHLPVAGSAQRETQLRSRDSDRRHSSRRSSLRQASPAGRLQKRFYTSVKILKVTEEKCQGRNRTSAKQRLDKS